MLYKKLKGHLKNQRGLAFLIFMIAIALSFITYTVVQLPVTTVKVEKIQNTRIALKKAKQALIAYAVTYNGTSPVRGPGYLLCPDIDNDGDAETACNGPFTIGRFPWRTLNTGDLRDSANERLWYAVSENFDYTASPTTGILPRKIINTATRGNITVRDSNNNKIYDGTAVDGGVAIIIAPGKVIKRGDGTLQNRLDVNNPINYLDVDTTSATNEDNIDFDQGDLGGSNDNGFIQGEIKDSSGNVIVNDIVEVITYSDLMSQVHKRVSQTISNLLNDYYVACDAYPEAAVYDPTQVAFNSSGAVPELRQGQLPFDSALPVNWGGVCDVGGVISATPNVTPWLFAEEWHKSSYYAFAYQNATHPSAPAADGLTCGFGGNPPCMTIINTLPLINNAQSIIMFAGRDTTGGNRPSGVMTDYFEVENSNLDDTYDNDEVEDYIRVVTP